jgi:hypothetical protein
MFMVFAHAPTASADRAPDDPREDRPEGCAHCRDAAAEQTEWQLGVLKELVKSGMRSARLVEQALVQAASGRGAPGQPAGAPPLGIGELVLAQTRIARSVRQSLALHDRFAEDRQARDKRREAEAAAKSAERAAAAERERRRQQKQEVKRAVERVIDIEVTDKLRAERLLTELDERLTDDDESDLGDRPLAFIVSRICFDIGVFFDPSYMEEGATRVAGCDAEDWGAKQPPTPSAVAGSDAASIAAPSADTG